MQNSKNAEPPITVGDLKRHLERVQLSPERFAKQAGLSHMTIRRWMKRDSKEEIAEKYHALLLPLLTQKVETVIPPFAGKFDFENLMDEVEKSGQNFENVEKLDRDVNEKLKKIRVDKIFIQYCKQMLTTIRSPKVSLKSKSIAIGALVYFLSPIDLIPDDILGVGYLDDFAVLSIAVNSIESEQKRIVLDEKKKAIPRPVESPA